MILWTPKNSGTYNIKVKKSKFISYGRSIKDISDFKSWLSRIKKDHYSASHFCWAYQYYYLPNIESNESDSGEPSGSAGKPILKCLKQKKIVNCGIVVVRYYGGKKLGRKGLIDAYGESAQNVIDQLLLIEYIKKTKYQIYWPIILYPTLSKFLKMYSKCLILNKNDSNIILEVILNSNSEEKFIKDFSLLSENKAIMKKVI